jgi:hypothetical protein
VSSEKVVAVAALAAAVSLSSYASEPRLDHPLLRDDCGSCSLSVCRNNDAAVIIDGGNGDVISEGCSNH